MSIAAARRHEEHYTLEEYLAMEEASPTRHEYHAGVIYAMAGGSVPHAQITFNVCGTLFNLLKGKRCRGGSSDQRIRIEAANVSLYPDAIVVCPPEQTAQNDPHALVNPALIVEVLSPSSENYNRNEKFELYAQIAELRDYLLVSQDRVLVEHFQRAENDGWLLRRFNRREDILRLDNLEIEVPVDEIYEGLDLPSGLVVWRQNASE